MQSLLYVKGSDGLANASLMTVTNVRSSGASTILTNTVANVPTYFYGTMGAPHTFTDPVTGETITVVSDATAVDFAGQIVSGHVEIIAIAPGYSDARGSAVGDVIVVRPVTEWANNLFNVLNQSLNNDGTIKAGAANRGVYPEQGFMINGKIVRTVATNNLTVAIKTLAGNDPSASDPVYVRIGDTVRTISAALSVTKNAGTNYFGKGASYFAGNESDFFVYLCWNTTDSAVTIAFSSTPAGRVYSDFSTTSTAWNYWAGSGSTPASTNEVEVVGRFNATLSASSSYNWSVPTTSVIINRPIFETRQFAFTNTDTAGGIFKWQQRGETKIVFGNTNQIAISGSGFAVNLVGLNLPTGFLATLDNFSAQTYGYVNTQYIVAGINTISLTSVGIYVMQLAGANGAASVSFRVQGT